MGRCQRNGRDIYCQPFSCPLRLNSDRVQVFYGVGLGAALGIPAYRFQDSKIGIAKLPNQVGILWSWVSRRGRAKELAVSKELHVER